MLVVEDESFVRFAIVQMLQSLGFTSVVAAASGKKALRAARQLRAGTVTVNCYGEGDITTPFGGYKLSGFGGRDNGLHAFDQYTETKTIWLDLGEHELDAGLD